MEATGGRLGGAKSKTILQVTGVNDAPSDGNAPSALLPFPGQDALAHKAKEWQKARDRHFSKLELQEPLQRRPHPKVLEIKLVPLDELKALLPRERTDAGYARIKERLILYESENEAKEQKRFHIQMSAYTTIYFELEGAMTRHASHLVDWARRLCDFKALGISGGYFDGPRLNLILDAMLTRKDRPRNEIALYEKADHMQRKARLPDGVAAEKYTALAHAFIENILPNLMRPYPPLEAARRLVDMMPKNLEQAGWSLMEELERKGLITDESSLPYVASRCRELVAPTRRARRETPGG